MSGAWSTELSSSLLLIALASIYSPVSDFLAVPREQIVFSPTSQNDRHHVQECFVNASLSLRLTPHPI